MIASVYNSNLTIPEKKEIIRKIDEMYFTPTEKAMKQLEKDEEAAAAIQREIAMKKIGESVKDVVTRIERAKNSILRNVAYCACAVVKGIADPLKEGSHK